MAKLLDESNRPVGTIDDDGIVRNNTNTQWGRVDLYYRSVHDKANAKVGYYDVNGHIFDENGSPKGSVDNNGIVKDYNTTIIGKVEGGHIDSGGAALLLLFN